MEYAPSCHLYNYHVLLHMIFNCLFLQYVNKMSPVILKYGTNLA
jgi:hypothetical protein